MSAKFTPGPWIAEACSSDKEMSQSTLATVAWVGDYRVRVGTETGVKGGNYRDGLHGDEMADAHLIAAAPDLLAALREIAEADHPDSPLSRGPVTEHEFGERLMRVARAAIAKAEGKS